jgi:hypothetical protein
MPQSGLVGTLAKRSVPLLLLSGDRPRDRGKDFGAHAFLTEGDEENFSFAVFKNQVGNAIRRLHGSFCHQPDIVGRVAARCLPYAFTDLSICSSAWRFESVRSFRRCWGICFSHCQRSGCQPEALAFGMGSLKAVSRLTKDRIYSRILRVRLDGG